MWVNSALMAKLHDLPASLASTPSQTRSIDATKTKGKLPTNPLIPHLDFDSVESLRKPKFAGNSINEMQKLA